MTNFLYVTSILNCMLFLWMDVQILKTKIFEMKVFSVLSVTSTIHFQDIISTWMVQPRRQTTMHGSRVRSLRSRQGAVDSICGKEDQGQYAVKAQTSLAPLSWFHGSRVTTAHAHQCCIFQSYAKTVPSRMKLTMKLTMREPASMTTDTWSRRVTSDFNSVYNISYAAAIPSHRKAIPWEPHTLRINGHVDTVIAQKTP